MAVTLKGTFQLHSCDTFVVLPPATKNGGVVFGKNSDRPEDEVQEVVHYGSVDHKPGKMLQCTYIEIPQVERTHAVILSKPGWMWGAEMGANEHGVVIGNEAVWTKVTGEQTTESLIGMDYVRLGLERSKTAREAVDVITSLLAKYGQSGRCFENDDWSAVTYDNSYLLADSTEAWVLETAGRLWAAQQIKEGVRNISNLLTIGSDITLMSPGLVERSTELGFYTPEPDKVFNFAEVFAVDAPVKRPLKGTAEYRFTEGRKLLNNYSAGGQFEVESMFRVLRDKDAGICCTGQSVSVGSQVSVLHPHSPQNTTHWFTATPNPSCSVFKPFIFKKGATPGLLVTCPDFGEEDPRITRPRFMRKVDRQHPLYSAHQRLRPLADEQNQDVLRSMRKLEQELIVEVQHQIGQSSATKSAEDKDDSVKDLFNNAAQREIQLYAGAFGKL